jgi:hypothetical protein
MLFHLHHSHCGFGKHIHHGHVSLTNILFVPYNFNIDENHQNCPAKIRTPQRKIS